MPRPRTVTVIVWLAVVQGILFAFLGLLLFQIVSLFGQESGVLFPLIVMLAETGGWFLLVLALMYFIFAVGTWRTKGWAWGMGLLVSALSILTEVSILSKGGSVVVASLFAIIPAIILWYLLSATGRQANGR